MPVGTPPRNVLVGAPPWIVPVDVADGAAIRVGGVVGGGD
jgi:hypothetical protein